MLLVIGLRINEWLRIYEIVLLIGTLVMVTDKRTVTNLRNSRLTILKLTTKALSSQRLTKHGIHWHIYTLVHCYILKLTTKA